MADAQPSIPRPQIVIGLETVQEDRSDSAPTPTSVQIISDFAAIENAVNEAAKRINSVWLAFLFIMTYMVISTGKISHKDLFLETPVKLPILAVDVPLRGYFFLVPAFVLAIHFYFSVQLSGLAGQFAEYERKMREAKITVTDRERLRHRLDNSVFARILGGPKGRLHFLLRAVGWISMGIAPPLIILFIELSYLPLQDPALTYWHRALLLLDTLLVAVYVLPLTLRKSKVERARLMLFRNVRWMGFVSTGASTLLAVWVGLFVAKFPWETMLFRSLTVAWLMPEADRFERPRTWFSNRLVLLDQNLVEGFDLAKAETTRALRDRNFVAAIFDRSDMRRVDFTGSDLSHASLSEAKLGKAMLSCAYYTDHEDFGCTRLISANLDMADLRGAYLSGAKMFGASLNGAKLDGASLFRTHLEGATLDRAALNAASLVSIGLDGASLKNVSLVGAVLRSARLRGANFSRANLIAADMDGSLAQNAFFEGTQLQGASMQLAHFEGASFTGVAVYGANVTDSSFSGARIVNVLTAPSWFRERPDIYGSASVIFEEDEQYDVFGKAGDGRLLRSPDDVGKPEPNSESFEYFKSYVPLPRSERERLDAFFPASNLEEPSASQVKERLSHVAPGRMTADWARLITKQASVENYNDGLGERLMIIACATAGGIEVTLGLVRTQTICAFRRKFDVVLKTGRQPDGKMCENAPRLRAVTNIWDSCWESEGD